MPALTTTGDRAGLSLIVLDQLQDNQQSTQIAHVTCIKESNAVQLTCSSMIAVICLESPANANSRDSFSLKNLIQMDESIKITATHALATAYKQVCKFLLAAMRPLKLCISMGARV
eukprot:scaffold217544_cov19-Prasinocladus_malaysianus.AAC.1